MLVVPIWIYEIQAHMIDIRLAEILGPRILWCLIRARYQTLAELWV